MKFKKWLFCFFIFLILVFVIDLIRIYNYQTFPKNPVSQFSTFEDEIYYELVNKNDNINWEKLQPTLNFIEKQYDVSDFKLVNLIRILYQYNNHIPVPVKNDIQNTLLNFRYWWDEPGGNSMCYWSENHQILFASAEFLIGKYYADEIFKNSNLIGRQHAAKARKRILDWLEMRWKFGFTEFYSGTYYKEDVAALINLIDFANDEEITEKSKIILDVLLYDVATQSLSGNFVSVSGRAYENNRKGGVHENLDGITYYLTGNKEAVKSSLVYGLINSKYAPPLVYREIINDTSAVIIKQKNGVTISDLASLGYNKNDDKSMMMQWGMEAFTNATVIRNSLRQIRKANMFSNAFLKDFKYLDFTVIRLLHLEPLLVRMLKPSENGKAIQQANTYTYRNKNYSLYSVQNYFPGSYADQHHVNGMNVTNDISIFHTNPAREKNSNAHSPNYWVGYGRLPDVAQYKNVSLSVYNIPEKKNTLENELLPYTHAYFPRNKFDSIYEKGNYIFGKKGDSYCALIGYRKLNYRDNINDDVIQMGNRQFWIIEAGRKEDDVSFNNFYSRILSNTIFFDDKNLVLKYVSADNTYLLKYDSDFSVNGKKQRDLHDRFESLYIDDSQNMRKISFNGKSLYLDFYNSVRREN